jgi:hypothetical protein
MLSFACMVLAALVLTIGFYVLLHAAGDPLPPCTDEIATHGGMCSGPLIDEP